MLRAVDCTVVFLKRLTFGPLELDPALQEGDWRELTADEVRLLREAAGFSE